MRFRPTTLLLLFPFFIAIFIFVQFHIQPAFREQGGDGFSFFTKSTKREKECECRAKSGNVYNFCYHLPENPTKRGKRFSCKYVDEWDRLETRSKTIINEKVDELPDPVFVTAFSDGFVRNGIRLITHIRKLGSKQKIVIYNLGINENDLLDLKKACNVEIRNFDFSKYPRHFSSLRDYRWKPIVIAEALADFGSIWYMDSSIILNKINLTHVYDLVSCQKTVKSRLPLLPSVLRDLRESREPHESGWDRVIWRRNKEECRKSSYLLHGYSGHGILSTTNPVVYQYLPTNDMELKKKKAKMYDAGFVYAVNSNKVRQKLVKWYVLCALEENCMGPRDSSLSCSFPDSDRFTHYSKCHRYDQSIINLLLANEFYYDRHYYVSEIVDFFKISRSSTDGYEPFLKCL